jgi:hypothetical protein
MIYERHLVKKLLEAAAGRRCEKTSETWSRAEMQRAVDDGQLKDMALVYIYWSPIDCIVFISVLC